MSLVAIDGGHVGAGDAVVLEVLVEWPHAHRSHALSNQIADGIIDHRRGDTRFQAKAIGQVRRDVEFAAADVNLALVRLAERNNAGIKTVNQRAERDQVELAFGGDIEAGGCHRDCGKAKRDKWLRQIGVIKSTTWWKRCRF